MKGETKSVTAVPSIIVSGTPGPSGYQSFTVKAVSTNTAVVYVGGPGVDNTGFPMAAGDSLNLNSINEALWAVSASGTQEIRVLRRGE